MVNKLSWEQIDQLSRKLTTIIKESGFMPDYLIGITAGGLIPLGLLAQGLGIRNILTVSAGSYTGTKQGELKIIYLPEVDLTGKRLLLIDEVSETGKTLERITNIIKEKYQPSELRTATLVVNTKESKFHPDFCSLEVQDWTVFPWEKEE